VGAAGAGPAVARPRRAFGGGVEFATLAGRLWAWLAWRADVHRQRHRLSEMAPWELRDIGLTPEQVWQECRKSFWRD
jgi:uncharacterized protein YjiS (DUF1127 family)